MKTPLLLLLLAFAGCQSSLEKAPQPAAPITSPGPATAIPPAAPPAPVAATEPAKVGRRGQQLLDIDIPPRLRRVDDRAQWLREAELAALEAKLADHERATGQQFAVLTWPDLGELRAADFGYTVAKRWALGDRVRNDGLLLFVAAKQREVDIEVGRGLESAITDELAATVIRETMRPAFRRGSYAAGLDAALTQLMAAGRAAER